MAARSQGRLGRSGTAAPSPIEHPRSGLRYDDPPTRSSRLAIDVAPVIPSRSSEACPHLGSFGRGVQEPRGTASAAADAVSTTTGRAARPGSSAATEQRGAARNGPYSPRSDHDKLRILAIGDGFKNFGRRAGLHYTDRANTGRVLSILDELGCKFLDRVLLTG